MKNVTVSLMVGATYANVAFPSTVLRPLGNVVVAAVGVPTNAVIEPDPSILMAVTFTLPPSSPSSSTTVTVILVSLSGSTESGALVVISEG